MIQFLLLDEMRNNASDLENLKKINKSLEFQELLLNKQVLEAEGNVLVLKKELNSLESKSKQPEVKPQQIVQGRIEKFEVLQFVPESNMDDSFQAGEIAMAQSNYPLSKLHFYQARDFGVDAKLVARADSRLADAYFLCHSFRQALYLFNRALQVYRENLMKKEEHGILELGIKICMGMKLYDQALGLALRQVSLSEMLDDVHAAEKWVDMINTAIENAY